MSAPELLTLRERQLLEAIREVLEIPYPARGQDRDAFEMALRERVFRLLGATDNLDGSFDSYIKALRDTAARPLGYEPAPSEHSE